MSDTATTPQDRFAAFSDDGRFLIAEAMRSFLANKQAAFDYLQQNPVPSAVYAMSATDFGIPALETLLTENGF